MVNQDEQLAHVSIQGTFHRFGDTITKYHGHVGELRGIALLAEFGRGNCCLSFSSGPGRSEHRSHSSANHRCSEAHLRRFRNI